jgi:hypothetical protein
LEEAGVVEIKKDQFDQESTHELRDIDTLVKEVEDDFDMEIVDENVELVSKDKIVDVIDFGYDREESGKGMDV